ncbi:MAG: hypothetical protein PVG03_01100 [Desulfarculaceae bacterium]|jgi:hypothetical protein
MSSCRFLYVNLITDPAQISPSSARTGLVGMPAPKAAGTAVAYAAGDYTGAQDQIFLIEIDSISAGKEVGQATYRWRRSSSDNWEASGQVTSDSLTPLADGVQIKWVSGPGDDFATGDSWTILASRSFGASALLDRDRDRVWEATGCSDEHLTVDMGEAKQVKALVLADHNLSDNATVTLMANSSDSWSEPAWSQGLSLTRPHLVAFIDQTYAWWRLRLQDEGNEQNLIRASILYLGSYFEPSRTFHTKYNHTMTGTRSVTSTDTGKQTGSAGGVADSWQLNFSGLTAPDLSGFRSLYENVHDRTTGTLSPVFFTPFAESPSGTFYCLPSPSLTKGQIHQGRYALKLALEEMVRTDV